MKKALKMTVAWRGLRPVFQVRRVMTALDIDFPEQTHPSVIS